MVVLNAFQSILSIVIMISVGYILTKKKWLNEEISKVFSKLVCNIALPCLMAADLIGNFTKDKLNHLGSGLIVPFASMAAGYGIAVLVSKLIRVKKGRIGIFRSMFFVSNSIFIGLPVNLALFGSKSVPYVLLYYIANTTFFWTIGAYGISCDGEADHINSSGVIRGVFSLETLKRIASPPLVGFLVALLLIMLEIRIPSFMIDTCRYLGNMTTPLSMLFIGITMYSVELKNIRIDKEMLALFLGRFIISPLLVLIVAYYYPVPALMKDVFTIQAAMPVMTNTAIVAKSYGADHQYATVMTVITTVLSIIFIPFYMAVI